MTVRQATIADLDSVALLFDAYRQFYDQLSDLDAARAFLTSRFEHQQSVILIAHAGERAVGFAQLFPSFSSTRMARTFILNDLFVAPDARGTGAEKALLDAACDYVGRSGQPSCRSRRPSTTLARKPCTSEPAGRATSISTCTRSR